MISLHAKYADFECPENSEDEEKHVQKIFSKFLQEKGAPLPEIEKMEEFLIWCITQCIFGDQVKEMTAPDAAKDHPALYADKKMIADARRESLAFDAALKQHQNLLFRTLRSKMKPKSPLYNFHQALQKNPSFQRDATGLFIVTIGGGGGGGAQVTFMPVDQEQADLLIAAHNVYFFGQYACSILYDVIQDMDIEDKSLIELWDDLRGPHAKTVPLAKWTWDADGATVFVKKITQLRDAFNVTRTWI